MSVYLSQFIYIQKYVLINRDVLSPMNQYTRISYHANMVQKYSVEKFKMKFV